MKNWTRSIMIGLAAPIVVSLFILAFLWPNATMKPKDLPVAMVGPEQAVTAMQDNIAAKQPDLLDVRQLSTRDEAVQAIKERLVYGAIILGDKPEVLTSSAASTSSSQIMSGMATTMGTMMTQKANEQAQAHGQPAGSVPDIKVPVTDVVPLSSDDPAGLGMSLVPMPLALGSIIAAALASFTLASARHRMLAIAIYAPLAGLAGSAIMGPWLDLLPGNFWSNAGIFTLSFAAISSFIAGLKSLMGPAGFGLGAMIIILLANPLSSSSYPYQFLLGHWGRIGHFLPIGSASTLMRSVNYFPDAPIGAQVITEFLWLAVGVGLLLTAAIFHDRRDRSLDSLSAADLEGAHDAPAPTASASPAL